MSLWSENYYNGAALAGGSDMYDDDDADYDAYTSGGFALAFNDPAGRTIPTASDLIPLGEEILSRLPQRNKIAFMYSFDPSNNGKYKLANPDTAKALLGFVYYIDSLNAQYILNQGKMRRLFRAGAKEEAAHLVQINADIVNKMKASKEAVLTDPIFSHYYNKFRKWMHGSKTRMSREDWRYLASDEPYAPTYHMRTLRMNPRTNAQMAKFFASYKKKHPGEPFPSNKAFAGLNSYKRFADKMRGRPPTDLVRKKMMVGSEIIKQIARTDPQLAADIARGTVGNSPTLPPSPMGPPPRERRTVTDTVDVGRATNKRAKNKIDAAKTTRELEALERRKSSDNLA